MPEFTRYLARICWMLRQGESVADVTLYLPTADVYDTLAAPNGGPGGARLDLLRACRAHIGDAIPAAIRNAGFDFDLVDDRLLGAIDPASVAAMGPVLLPRVERMPERTRAWMRAVQAAGGTVLDLRDGTSPRAGAPLGRVVREDALGEALRACIRPDLNVEPACADIGFVHRRLKGLDVYFVANTGTRTRRVAVTPRTQRRAWQLWNATTGHIGAAGDVCASIPLELASYEAAVLVVGDELTKWDGTRGSGLMNYKAGALESAEMLGSSRVADSGFRGEWTVAFPGAEPAPVTLPHDWASERPRFVGTATYECRFQALALHDGRMPSYVELDFGDTIESSAAHEGERGIRGTSYQAMVEPPIREVADIEMNGVDCGVLYAPPYRVDVTHAVRPGLNVLRVAVGNATAAALNDPDVIDAIDASIDGSDALYGARFRMQDLERAAVGLRSGLLTVPTMRWSLGVDK